MQGEINALAPSGASEMIANPVNENLLEIIGKMEVAFWRWDATPAETDDLAGGSEFSEYIRLETLFINLPCDGMADVKTKVNYVLHRPHILDTPDYFEPFLRSLAQTCKGGAA